MNAILIITTTDSPDLAHRIAADLVEAGEAACVNILPGLRSIYRWKGKLCDEGEVLLLIKSVPSRYESVRAHIRQLHTYQVPEIIALPITSGDPDYLDWIEEQTGCPPHHP